MSRFNWVILVSMLVSLSACSSQAAEVTREVPVTVEVTHEVEVTRVVVVTQIVEVTPRPTPAPAARPLVGAGETVQYGLWEYSVTQVLREQALVGGFETVYPGGGVFVVVFLKVKNLGLVQDYFHEGYLVIEDSMGRVYAATESLAASQHYDTPHWFMDELQPGGQWEIPLAFDVAQDAENLILHPVDSPVPAISLP